jgi:hypothetical protein
MVHGPRKRNSSPIYPDRCSTQPSLPWASSEQLATSYSTIRDSGLQLFYLFPLFAYGCQEEQGDRGQEGSGPADKRRIESVEGSPDRRRVGQRIRPRSTDQGRVPHLLQRDILTLVQGFVGAMALHEMVRFGGPRKSRDRRSAGQRLHPRLAGAYRRTMTEGGGPGRLHFQVAS